MSECADCESRRLEFDRQRQESVKELNELESKHGYSLTNSPKASRIEGCGHDDRGVQVRKPWWQW